MNSVFNVWREKSFSYFCSNSSSYWRHMVDACLTWFISPALCLYLATISLSLLFPVYQPNFLSLFVFAYTSHWCTSVYFTFLMFVSRSLCLCYYLYHCLFKVLFNFCLSKTLSFTLSFFYISLSLSQFLHLYIISVPFVYSSIG